MTNTFADLKKSRTSSLDKLTKEVEKLSSNKSQSDERFWYPDVDKAGNGYAVVRFLPAPKGEDVPWIRIWSHGFQGPGGWYIENSLTTIGQADPVSEYNTKLWNSGIDSDKDQARKQKRKLNYISNIYVISDPAHPENEGKVFLFKYGKKIFDKINDVMNPTFKDETPVNPFDFWEGADFKIKIRKVEGYRNYDKSEFDKPSPLAEDKELEAIWKQEHSLSEFVAPTQFKSYSELKTRLTRVLAMPEGSDRPDEDPPFDKPYKKVAEAAEPKSAPATWEDDGGDNESGDDLSFFQKLSQEDD